MSSFKREDLPTLGKPIIATRPSPLLATSKPYVRGTGPRREVGMQGGVTLIVPRRIALGVPHDANIAWRMSNPQD